MAIIRHEGEFAVHAEAKLPGLTSRVMSKLGKDGETYTYHVLQDELSDNLEHYPASDFQTKENTSGKFQVYTIKGDKGVHEHMKRHVAAIDAWTELYVTDGITFADAIRHAASNKHLERNAHV